MSCLNCNNDLRGKQKLFCSKSCATTYNNKLHPKRTKMLKPCKSCTNLITGGNAYCKECLQNQLLENKTLGQIVDKRVYQAHSRIREHARYYFHKANPDAICKNCGYFKHVEVCHIKAIHLFDRNTLIRDINSPDNLVALCPNCHWEFDNNCLTIDQINRLA